MWLAAHEPRAMSRRIEDACSSRWQAKWLDFIRNCDLVKKGEIRGRITSVREAGVKISTPLRLKSGNKQKLLEEKWIKLSKYECKHWHQYHVHNVNKRHSIHTLLLIFSHLKRSLILAFLRWRSRFGNSTSSSWGDDSARWEPVWPWPLEDLLL